MKRARPIAFLLVGFSLTLLGAVVSGSSTASVQEHSWRQAPFDLEWPYD